MQNVFKQKGKQNEKLENDKKSMLKMKIKQQNKFSGRKG
jgi:hypothetical protein